LPKAVLSALRSVKNADYLSDLVSYTLLDDYYDKQAMLETLDTDERLEKLLGLLQKKIQQFEAVENAPGQTTQQTCRTQLTRPCSRRHSSSKTPPVRLLW